MHGTINKWDQLITILLSIQYQLEQQGRPNTVSEFVHVPFKGSEIYLLCKAFVDAGGALHDNYKTLIEKTAPNISNKTQKGFSADSLSKYSDKVDPASKENIKRFLQKMIRNIDSYD
jgi:hypothetical protein